MAKPAGPRCNLRCSYCFYLEKGALFVPGGSRRMDDAALQAFVHQYIAAQPGDNVVFSWQGGEPTVLGVDYFRRIVDLQRRYAAGKTIENALQTNGTLLDDEWGAFLKEHEFLVGISIDGPPALHDAQRLDPAGRGSLGAALRGLDVLQRHDVPFNTLTCVSAANAAEPLAVYRFLKQIGSRHMQFIPVVELVADAAAQGQGLTLGMPQAGCDRAGELTSWSVTGERWGRFLATVYDEWLREDIGEIYVDLFELTLAKWLGIAGGSCVHAQTCGDALAIEHDGSVYSCDHYVYPQFRLGNVLQQPLAALVDGARQQNFGRAKQDGLTAQCRRCPMLFACNGGCPKHRSAVSIDGQPGHNQLCAGYLDYFGHVDPSMQLIASLYSRGADMPTIKRAVAANH